MARKNRAIDVWKHINMHGGDKSVCWEWQLRPSGVPSTGTGRGKARAYFSVNGRKVLATRLVMELVHGVTLSRNQFVCHTCDNPICCNPEHMYIGDAQSNNKDASERDRHGLPSHVVRRIRVLLSRKMTHQEIADRYGIDRSIVTKINTDSLHTNPADYPTAEDFDADAQEGTDKNTD